MGVREVMLMKEPIHTPHICISCGCGANDRPYFVDLGLNSELVVPNEDTGLMHFTEGVVYLCNICMEQIFKEYNIKVFAFIEAEHRSRVAEMEEAGAAAKSQTKEIKELRAQINELKGQLAKEPLEEAQEEAQMTGEDIARSILGEDLDGTESSDRDVAGDDSSAAGDNRNIESNDANEPPVISAITLGG